MLEKNLAKAFVFFYGIFLVSLTSAPVNAEDHFGIEANYLANSDDLSRNEILARWTTGRFDITYPYADEILTRTSYFGFKVRGVDENQKVFISNLNDTNTNNGDTEKLKQKYGELTIEWGYKHSSFFGLWMELGYSGLVSKRDLSPDFSKFSFQSKPAESHYLIGSMGREIFETLPSVKQILSSNYLKLHWIHYPNSGIRLQVKPEIQMVAESQKKRLDFQIDFGQVTPWMWVGLGYEIFQWSKTHSSFWSPEEFASYGIRAEGSMPISDSWTITGSGSLNQTTEKYQNKPGTSSSASVVIQHGDRSQQLWQIGLSKSQSLQSQNIWQSQQFYLKSFF